MAKKNMPVPKGGDMRNCPQMVKQGPQGETKPTMKKPPKGMNHG